MIEHLDSRPVRNAVGVIELDPLEIPGHPALSDPLCDRVAVIDSGMPMLDPGLHRRSVGIGTDNFDFLVSLL